MRRFGFVAAAASSLATLCACSTLSSADQVRTADQAIHIARTKCEEPPNDQVKGAWSARRHGRVWDVDFIAVEDRDCRRTVMVEIDAETGKVESCKECVAVDSVDRVPVAH